MCSEIKKMILKVKDTSDTRSKFIVTDSLHINKTEELLAESTLLKEIILIEKDIDDYSIDNPNININPEDLY